MIACRSAYTRGVSKSGSESVDAERIRRVASGVGVTLQQDQLGQLAGFARLFLTWNERINLGGTISADELADRHFVDAFAASRFIEDGARVVDVGSGGGLPAVPLAIIRPDLRFDLFEPTGKKVAFLRTAIRELGLKDRVLVHSERVVPGGARGTPADVAMSRATLPPENWLVLGRTMVARTGCVLVYATAVPSGGSEQPRKHFGYAPDRCLLVYGQEADSTGRFT
jgi:16S rRNA (guanine(527)-N(7))-methyltransferase RsmG